jgi:ParB/RepB/Spo0J family partition protein
MSIFVPINSIAVINRQRKEMELVDVQELANDIKARGLLHPLVVRSPHPHEVEQVKGLPYVLMVGGRRLAAHHLLGRTKIEVRLKDDLSPIDARIAELSENVVRVNLTWEEETAARAELARALQEANPAANLEEVAKEVGVSKAQLSKDIALDKAIKADPKLKAATSKGSAIRIAAYKATVQERIEKVTAERLRGGEELRSRLHTADGRDFIKTIPSQSIDMVFSDLPYGIDYFDGLKGASEATTSNYDDSAKEAKSFIKDVVPDMLRVVKPSGWIVLFMCYEWHEWLQQELAKPHYMEHLQRSNELKPEMPPWIWTRRGKGNHGHWPELHAASRYEMIVVVNGGSAKLMKKPCENVLDFPPFSGERSHAMQKPHDLCRELIERCTVAGERVLDVCFGSGAHLAAAASLGRDFIGCEKNPNLLNSAITLVSQYYKPTIAHVK